MEEPRPSGRWGAPCPGDVLAVSVTPVFGERGGRAVLMVNVPLLDRDTAVRWARRHLADGELFATWTVAEAA